MRFVAVVAANIEFRHELDPLKLETRAEKVLAAVKFPRQIDPIESALRRVSF
jgi:hypothetical protein